MSKFFKSITDFIQHQSECVFCQQPLHAELTNYVGLRGNDLPILNVEIANCQPIYFRLRHTTENYHVEAEVDIDLTNNYLSFCMPQTETPFVDRNLALQAFDDLKPFIDLYCANPACKYGYHVSSDNLFIQGLPNANNQWTIEPIKLYLEGFKTPLYKVLSDCFRRETYIYVDDVSVPIKTAQLNFQEMGKNKLLNRLNTIVLYT